MSMPKRSTPAPKWTIVAGMFAAATLAIGGIAWALQKVIAGDDAPD